MSRIYKVCIHGHPKAGRMEIFAIKPYLESFDNLKEEIFIRKPELKNRDIRIYYTDDEDDRITILNALDYAIFKESGFNRVFIAVPNDDVDHPKEKSPSVPVAPQTLPMELDVPESASAQDEAIIRPVLTYLASAPKPVAATAEKVFHPGVVCDGCDKSIFGFRYKCMDCVDFDLCMECESKMLHSEHIMLRISNPNEIDLCKLKLRKRMGRHRHGDESNKADARPTEPKRPHHGHGHHDRHGHGHGHGHGNGHGHGHGRGHGKRNTSPHRPIISSLDLLNSFFANQSAQTPATATSPTAQQSNQSTQADGNSNRGKEPSPPKKVNAGVTFAPNATATGASQTSPIAACIQNIPEFIRMGIQKAQSAPASKCPMQANYKAGLDALADLANNFAVMMDPFAASFDLQSTSEPTPAPAATPAKPTESAKPAASAESAEPVTPVAPTNLQVPVAPRKEKSPSIVDELGLRAVPAATSSATTTDQNRVPAESVLIEDVDDDEDELMRDLLKKMTTFNSNAEKKNAAEVSEKTSAATSASTSMETDRNASPEKEWTLLDQDDTYIEATSEKSSTGTIPKRPLLVTDAAEEALKRSEEAQKRAEIASSAAYAAVQAAAQAQEKAEQVEYAELSRLLGDHIKGAAANSTQSKPVSRVSAVISDSEMTPSTASAPPPATSPAEKRVQDALAAMIAMGFSNEGGWLTQLLEAVDGNIPRALDLLQPHK